MFSKIGKNAVLVHCERICTNCVSGRINGRPLCLSKARRNANYAEVKLKRARNSVYSKIEIFYIYKIKGKESTM